MERFNAILTTAAGIASVAALCVTFYSIGYWIGRRRKRAAVSTHQNIYPAAVAVHNFVKASLAKSPADIDIVGYSVHALLDSLQPILRRALAAGKRVRILMLSPGSSGLLEKSALEREHHAIDIARLRERNSTQIRKTCQRLHDLAEDIRYQSNIGQVRLEVRVYNQLPIYRGARTESGDLVVGPYLIDPLRPGRDLDHLFASSGTTLDDHSDREARAFDNWYKYLWQSRSRPVGIATVLFDLYDTLIVVPPADSHAARAEMSRLIGVSEYELANYWEATRAASNKGEISSTEERFGRICQLAGKDVDIALNKRLASIEHDMLAKSIEFCPHALETLRTLRNKGYQIAVSSNSSASAVGAINASGVGSNVDSICLSFEVGELKPSAEMYTRPLEALGSTPSQSVFVGDGANDELRGAKGVGLTTVCVGGSAAGREAADFTIRDLDELVAVLERLPTLSAGLKREA